MVKLFINTDGQWHNEYIGQDCKIKFYPDAYANYWRYELIRTEEVKYMGLKITGLYPNARYMSFNVYNDKNFSPIASITDNEINPDANSINPFTTKKSGNIENKYTIYVVPKGAKNIAGENVITYDNDLAKIAIILRYYLPLENKRGGVPLPTIEAFNTQTGEPLILPEKNTKALPPYRKVFRSSVGDVIIKNLILPLFLLNRGEELHSYHIKGNGMYPNKDNKYLVMPIKKKKNEIALIRFKAPVVGKDVRYFSVGQGDEKSHNLLSMYDEELKIADDGYVYLAIGDKKASPKSNKEYNYMPWKTNSKMVLIYRNLVSKPSFTGSIENVPSIKQQREPADNYIGEYAPIGKLVSYTEFEEHGFESIFDK